MTGQQFAHPAQILLIPPGRVQFDSRLTARRQAMNDHRRLIDTDSLKISGHHRIKASFIFRRELRHVYP